MIVCKLAKIYNPFSHSLAEPCKLVHIIPETFLESFTYERLLPSIIPTIYVLFHLISFPIQCLICDYHYLVSVTNECADPDLNNCEQICTDTDIAYTCSCNAPESLGSDGFSCLG